VTRRWRAAGRRRSLLPLRVRRAQAMVSAAGQDNRGWPSTWKPDRPLQKDDVEPKLRSGSSGAYDAPWIPGPVRHTQPAPSAADSPRAEFGHWARAVALRVGWSKIQVGADAEAVGWLRRSIEANPAITRLRISCSPARWRCLGRWTRQGPPRRRGWRSIQTSPSAAGATPKSSDNPAYLAARERLYEGLRLAGVPASSWGAGGVMSEMGHCEELSLSISLPVL
jgi:hypothetical protein